MPVCKPCLLAPSLHGCFFSVFFSHAITVRCLSTQTNLRSLSLSLLLTCSWLKALLNSSHKYHDAVHSFAHYGVIVKDVKIDWAAMQKQKDTAVSGLTKGIEGLLKKNKVRASAPVTPLLFSLSLSLSIHDLTV